MLEKLIYYFIFITKAYKNAIHLLFDRLPNSVRRILRVKQP